LLKVQRKTFWLMGKTCPTVGSTFFKRQNGRNSRPVKKMTVVVIVQAERPAWARAPTGHCLQTSGSELSESDVMVTTYPLRRA
jgi:hypothetical protein